MTERFWIFSALDSLFFRDGTPYNAGEGGQSGVSGCFPPYMTTLQGAVRTALAVGQGWTPENPEKWPQELGNPGHLGNLRLRGPYLLIDEQLLFPAPLMLMQKKDKDIRFSRLVPGEKVDCDLGQVRLPELKDKIPGAKLMEKQWLTAEGLKAVLAGGLPEKEQVFEQDKLWREESRVGIEREKNSRTAADGKIYSSIHVRPGDFKHKVSLGVYVDGVPGSWHEKAARVTWLGGEGRLACLEIKETGPELPPHPEIKPQGGKVRFTATLITPGWFDNLKEVIKNGPVNSIPGELVSACIGKVEQVGGWDIKNHCPRPLKPLLPAGTTWFFEAAASELEQVYSLHGQCIGDNKEKQKDKDKTAYGFGQIVIGRWGDGE